MMKTLRHTYLNLRRLIPKWMPILKETGKEIREAQLLLTASSLAYTTLLSIIPLLAVSFAIFQTFGGMDKLYSIIEPFILSNLAQSAGEEAIQAIRGFISNIKVKTLGVGGLAALIFTCIALLSSCENAINRVWKSPVTRPLFQRIAAYWFFITIGPIGFSVVFAVVSSKEMRVIRLLPAGIGGYLLAVAVIAAIYKWTPNRRVHWLAAVVPAAITAGLLGLARAGYSLYTTKVVSYHTVYGSLGAVPIFLVWLYLLWTIILAGVALGASMQKRLESR